MLMLSIVITLGVIIGQFRLFGIILSMILIRLMHGDQVVVPTAETKMHVGDVLHVVSTKNNFNMLAIMVGETSKIDLRKVESDLTTPWNGIQAIQRRGVECGLLRRKPEAITQVGIDEKSFLSRRRYVGPLP